MDTIKILIVDDMRIISELIASLLDELNEPFQYLYALNGKDACKIAQAARPDLVIMDWEMPVMSGYDALLRMKKNDALKDIPVIISSGFTESENIRMALEGGAIDYIRKPIDSIELIARVRSVLALTSAYNKLREQTVLLNKERERTQNIIKGYLPDVLVNEILNDGFLKPRRYKDVSVLFADLVDFTSTTNSISPKCMFNELSTLFPAFDEIMHYHGCEKIKTIGDAYLASCGFPKADPEHAVKLARAAVDMVNFISLRNKTHQNRWRLRIGIHSGDMFAGLIGKENYHFDVFGDTINTAARMQQHADPMQINLSDKTNDLVKNHFQTVERVPLKVKGKGVQKMYYLYRPIIIDSELYHQSFDEHPLAELILEKPD